MCPWETKIALTRHLQVSARLTALSQMGHATDKIELIVLGGTWSDYPQGYQIWFMSELFRALNDDAVAGVAANPMLARPGISRAEAGRLLDDAPADALPPVVAERREAIGPSVLRPTRPSLRAVLPTSRGVWMLPWVAITARCASSVRTRYAVGRGCRSGETATMDELERQQRVNETAEASRGWGSLSRRAPML